MTVASLPHMERKDAQRVIRGYEHVARDILELVEGLQEDHDYEDISKLKQALK